MTTPTAEIASRIEEMKQTIAEIEDDDPTHPATELRNILANYEAELARLGDDETPAPRAHALTARPAAGSPAANQYGTFQVSYSTQKQTNFIKALMDRKDLSGFEGDVALLQEQVAATKVNKKAASAIIDRLLALPDVAPATQGRPATDKQKEFVRALLAERAGNEEAETIRHALNIARESGQLNAAFISDAITRLLETPKVAAPGLEFKPGVYVLPDDTLVRVYIGQNSGQLLAKVVVDGDLEYAGKASKVLAPGSRKATIEEVGEWGRTTGTCLVCGRRLDDPESVDRGIGPVCYGRMS